MDILLDILGYLLTAGVWFLIGIECVLLMVGEVKFNLATWLMYGLIAIVGIIV